MINDYNKQNIWIHSLNNNLSVKKERHIILNIATVVKSVWIF
jgi:hypothetical protein